MVLVIWDRKSGDAARKGSRLLDVEYPPMHVWRHSILHDVLSLVRDGLDLCTSGSQTSNGWGDQMYYRYLRCSGKDIETASILHDRLHTTIIPP